MLIDMDRHTVALIRDMTDAESNDELIQFSEALQETLMSETAHQMTVALAAAEIPWRKSGKLQRGPACH